MSLSLPRLFSALSLLPSNSPSSTSLPPSQLPLPSKTYNYYSQSLVAVDVVHVPSSSSVCPSLSHANVLFFKSAYYNVQIVVQDNEPEDRLLNRFRREVLNAGVIQECKRRRFFENKQDYKKRKVRDSAKRNRRRRPPAKSTKKSKQETHKKKVEDGEENDNWDLPDVDLPYC